MFPRPIEQTRPLTQRLYTIALPIALILWLLPLIGVAVTSVRPASDLAQGNYFGMPSSFAMPFKCPETAAVSICRPCRAYSLQCSNCR